MGEFGKKKNLMHVWVNDSSMTMKNTLIIFFSFHSLFHYEFLKLLPSIAMYVDDPTISFLIALTI